MLTKFLIIKKCLKSEMEGNELDWDEYIEKILK